ncbi:MAG TPA: hypothetical protein VFS00_32260, partial [Polyangiaceae bacterium]|nr:hypothetical protein [Polyangiaceae bacterium]
LRHFRLLLSEIDVGPAHSGAFAVPEVLDEGAGLHFLQLVGGAPSRARALGELWATPVRASFSPSPDENRLAAALAVGNELVDSLPEDQQKALAYRGRAVSPVTSYLAVEPGVRPSTEGLLEGGSGIGGSGGGSGVGLGRIGTIGRGGPGFDHAAFLREALRKGWRACGGGDGGVALTIETTLAEVVEVRGVAASEIVSKHLEPCLAEAAWSLELPAGFRSEHDRFDLAL